MSTSLALAHFSPLTESVTNPTQAWEAALSALSGKLGSLWSALLTPVKQLPDRLLLAADLPTFESLRTEREDVLSIQEAYPGACLEAWEELARRTPGTFLYCLLGARYVERGGVAAVHAGNVAEAAGQLTRYARPAVHLLIQLTEHPDPYVRLGAVRGLIDLAEREENPDIRWTLEDLTDVEWEPHPGVRRAALDALLLVEPLK